MTQVRQLTVAQKDQLVGQKWNANTIFNPVLDADGEWFISNEEVDGYMGIDFPWVNALPSMDHNPVIVDI